MLIHSIEFGSILKSGMSDAFQIGGGAASWWPEC